MKILLLIVFICYLPVQAQYKIRTAQTDFIKQGMFTIGGNFSFSAQSYDDADSRFVFNFSPSVSYFLLGKLSLGLSAYINNISVGGSRNTEWGAGPFARYYLSVRKFAPFLGVGMDYGSNTNSVNDDKYATTRIILTGGIDYFITRNVAVESVINYMFINEKFPDRFNIDNLDSRLIIIAVGLNIFI
jgi:hypothetical protein